MRTRSSASASQGASLWPECSRRARCLPAGRVVVVPSRAESLPYIVLEAGAAARPVIATRVGGITEIFGPTAGALIAPDSVDALVTAMQQVLHDPAAAREQAHLRHRFIREHFSLPRMVDRIEAAYRVALMQDS